MDELMCVYSTDYLSRFKGYDIQQQKNFKTYESGSTYKFKPDMDMETVKAKLAVVRANKEQEQLRQKTQKLLDYEKGRLELRKMHIQMRREKGLEPPLETEEEEQA